MIITNNNRITTNNMNKLNDSIIITNNIID